MEEILNVSGISISKRLDEKNLTKLNTFLHPGRNELMLADNVILVEGYTEEIILKSYLRKCNNNWTVINVAGVMFEPYIKLASLLNKKLIVVSDNDKSLSDTKQVSKRFEKLKVIFGQQNIKLIEIENTLETDLYNNGFLNNCISLLKQHEKHPEYFVAKEKKKIEIAEKLIESNVDLSEWHVIKEIDDEFKGD